MKSKTDVALQWKKHLAWTKKGLSAQYDNTRFAQSFYDGDFMDYEDKIAFVDQLGRRKRAIVQFNKVKRPVDTVAGFMAQNRQQAKYIARLPNSNGQRLFSRYSNALADYVRENANADQIETQQDYDLLIAGYGATETDISYIQGNATTDPNGEILKARLDPLNVGWDVTAKAKNLTDARWAYYFEDYDLGDAIELFDDSDEEDFEPVDRTDPQETGYHYYPYGGRFDKIREQDSVEWASKEENRVRVYNYQWFEYKTFYRANNPLYSAPTPEAAFRIQVELDIIAEEAKQSEEYGDMFDFDPRAKVLTFDEKTKTKLVGAFGRFIKPVGFKRKCFYTAIISGSHVFSTFKSICQQGFSIEFKTGNYNNTKKIWVGMVNALAEPTKYYNKSLTELMFTIASNSKGGVMIESDAVEDVADFEAKWAKTDAVIQVNPGAIAAGKIQEKTKAALPTGLEGIIQLSDAACNDAGVDPSFMGSVENKQETGILFKRKIRQIISSMAWAMDAVTLYKKIDARLLLDYLRIYAENNDGAMFRITGEDGEMSYAQISSDKLSAEYDVTIQEAPQTPEDKEETAQLLSNIGDKLLAAQDIATAKAIYVEGIQFLSLDGDVKQRLIQALQPKDNQIDPQEHEMLKQQVQILSSETNQADVQQKLSTAELNREKIKEVRANATLKGGQLAKTIEEAQKTDVETDILRKSPIPKEESATI